MNKFLIVFVFVLLAILTFGGFYFLQQKTSPEVIVVSKPVVTPVSDVTTVKEDPTVLFTSRDALFSVRLPTVAEKNNNGYGIDESFKNTLSPKLIIEGVKFTIPETYATGTNLSPDTYLSVEHMQTAHACTADLFFDTAVHATQKTEGGVMYSVATSSDAGAGNRYQEIVYALSSTSPCIALRYMIHSHALENYAENTVTAFNAGALIAEFDTIRQSLIVKRL